MGLCSQIGHRQAHEILDDFASLGSQQSAWAPFPGQLPPPSMVRGTMPSQAVWKSYFLGPMFLRGRGILLII